jgi:hypothetical protein
MMRQYFVTGNYVLQVAVRYFLAYWFISYSIAKLAGTQFITLGALLDTPIRCLTGFELTWIYFGYSPLYSYVIALSQLAAAVMLLFARTRRIGAVLLLTIVGNIVLVNFGYHISTETKIMSVLFLVLTLYLILCDVRAYFQCFIVEAGEKPGQPAYFQARPWLGFTLAIVAGLGFLAYETWHIQSLKQQYMATTKMEGDYYITDIMGELPTELVGMKRISLEPGTRVALRTEKYLLHGSYQYNANAGELIISVMIPLVLEEYDSDRRLENLDLPIDMSGISDEDLERMMAEQGGQQKSYVITATVRWYTSANLASLQGTLNGKPLTFALKKRVWKKV